MANFDYAEALQLYSKYGEPLYLSMYQVRNSFTEKKLQAWYDDFVQIHEEHKTEEKEMQNAVVQVEGLERQRFIHAPPSVQNSYESLYRCYREIDMLSMTIFTDENHYLSKLHRIKALENAKQKYIYDLRYFIANGTPFLSATKKPQKYSLLDLHKRISTLKANISRDKKRGALASVEKWQSELKTCEEELKQMNDQMNQ
jgi:DNA repair ATPase RecN